MKRIWSAVLVCVMSLGVAAQCVDTVGIQVGGQDYRIPYRCAGSQITLHPQVFDGMTWMISNLASSLEISNQLLFQYRLQDSLHLDTEMTLQRMLDIQQKRLNQKDSTITQLDALVSESLAATRSVAADLEQCKRTRWIFLSAGILSGVAVTLFLTN